MNVIFHADIFAFVDFQMFCFVSFRKGFFCRSAQSGKLVCITTKYGYLKGEDGVIAGDGGDEGHGFVGEGDRGNYHR